MTIDITKPIIFFDLETTGVSVVKDRIVSISAIKVMPNTPLNESVAKATIVNPTIPIPAAASAIHGIFDKDVAGKPTFSQLAKSMYEFYRGCDIAGFNNNHFDNMLLAEEFGRCNLVYPFQDTASADVGVLFKKMEGRGLKHAVKFYLDEDFTDGAHDSSNDILMTLRVFLAMKKKYPELKDKSIKEIDDFCKLNPKQVDYHNRLVRDEKGYLVFNFGRAEGKRVMDDLGFTEWCLNTAKDFPMQVKNLLKEEIKRCAKLHPNKFK